MARLFINKVDIASRITWFYVLMSKSPVEIYEYNDENEELEEENPIKMVPFLMDGDVKIWGSQACILYLAEKHGTIEEFGKANEGRAKIESMLSWATSSLFRNVAEDYVVPKLYDEGDLNGEYRRLQIEFGKKAVHEQLDVMESRYLKKNKFILGKEVHFVDYYIGMILSMLDKVDFDFSKWPHTFKWYKIIKDDVYKMIQEFQGE